MEFAYNQKKIKRFQFKSERVYYKAQPNVAHVHRTSYVDVWVRMGACVCVCVRMPVPVAACSCVRSRSARRMRASSALHAFKHLKHAR